MEKLTDILGFEAMPHPLILECIRQGQPCFDELVGLLKNGQLNETQQVNALDLLCSLVRENLFHRGYELVDMLSTFAMHENVRVRSEAASAAISFVKAAEAGPNFKIEPMTRDVVAARLREGLVKGYRPATLEVFVRQFCLGKSI